MHDVIAFLKAAVTRGPSQGVSGCYCVANGSIYARNHAMQAGVAMDTPVPFNVPADELEAALARMKQVDELVVQDGSLLVRGGRLRSVIQCVADDPPPLPPLPDEWLPVPPDFCVALGIASKFVGESGWTAGIRLWDGRVTAMSNRAGVDIALPGLVIPATMITSDVANFLVAQGDPREYSYVAGHALVFRWEDGRWLRAQLMTDVMPDVDKVLDGAGEAAPIAITDSWREALADAVALSDGVVEVTSEGFKGSKGAGSYDVDCSMELPTDHRSKWEGPWLEAIASCAEAWNPTSYPSPAAFKGPGLRGVLVGRR